MKHNIRRKNLSRSSGFFFLALLLSLVLGVMTGFAAQSTPQESGSSLHLVQFNGPIKDEWLESLDLAGAKPVHYIATYQYLVWADENARAELDKMVANEDFLESSIFYPQDLKLGQSIQTHTDPDEIVEVVIQMYRHPAGNESEAAIESLSVTL